MSQYLSDDILACLWNSRLPHHQQQSIHHLTIKFQTFHHRSCMLLSLTKNLQQRPPSSKFFGDSNANAARQLPHHFCSYMSSPWHSFILQNGHRTNTHQSLSQVKLTRSYFLGCFPEESGNVLLQCCAVFQAKIGWRLETHLSHFCLSKLCAI